MQCPHLCADKEQDMTTNTLNTHASSAIDSRRGSALLIVVGTLALIAVFAAIYISIGQSDQRVAQSVRAKQELDGYQNTIADHILGVIAADRLDLTTQHADTNAGIFLTREVTDAPYTDWTMLSESANDYEKFNPSGGHTLSGPTADTDYRVASDPWLASTSPTYLGNPGDPFYRAIVGDERPFASAIQDNASGYIANTYSSGFLDNRDWLQISNLAPDGRFVNLFNLRPNAAESNGFGDPRIGGFGSEPGTGQVTQGARNIRRMSEYLSLWNQEVPADPNSRIIAVDPAVDGIWIPGRNAPELNHGLFDVTNTPAVWTMYQRFAFLPLNQPFMTVNRNAQISTWADPDYAPYQWADADGDGMADARWFELISAQENQSSNSDPRTDIERLYDAGQYRLFAAARVVDLSSMVNVNTAMDQLATPEPQLGAPIGATPADIDLRRLLSMTDVGHNYAAVPLAGLSPSFFHKPVLTTNNDLFDVDYKWYRNYIDTASTTPFKTIEPSTNALSIGRYAYDAIKLTIEHGGTLDERYYAWPPEVRATNSTLPEVPTAISFDDDFNPPDIDIDNASVYRLDQYHDEPTLIGDNPMTAENRTDWYNLIGRVDPFGVEQSDSTSINSVGSLYNQDDLFELLAFHGLNDPATVSRLEKAAMGRMPSIFGQNQRAFSPLLSNRPLSLDRERHGYVATDSAYFDPNAGGKREITGGVAKESMAFFAVTPRRLLTVVSGSSAIKPGTVVSSATPSLVDAEAAQTLPNVLGSAGSLFDIYSKALASELDARKLGITADQAFVLDPTLSRTDPAAGPTSTLFYGHKGPELALRIAAHAAVNMKDLNDNDHEPTAATLIIDDTTRDNLLTDYDGEDANDPAYAMYAGRATNNVFDPGFTPDNKFTGAQEGRKAVNVFGIEPMPFLTEMSSMYVYTDSAGSAGDDYNETKPRIAGGFVTIPTPNIPVDIDGDVSDFNEDFMMQVLAFQLTNPWDDNITIGGTDAVGDPMGYLDDEPTPSNTNLTFDYYIEFGGRFFKLGEFVEYNPGLEPIFDPAQYPDNPPPHADPQGAPITSSDEAYQYRSVTIPANSSRVFYAIAHSRFDGEDSSSDIDDKWLRNVGALNRFTAFDPDGDTLNNGYDGKGWTGPAEEWVNGQFQTRGGPSAVHIHQFDPRTGELLEQNGFNDLFSAPAASDAAFPSGDRAYDFTQARLWRKIAGNLEESTANTLPIGAIRENIIQNDMLVDRLKSPGGETLDRVQDSDPIEGSVGYDPDTYTEADEATVGVRNDNKGFSIVRWATIRRGDSNTEAPNQTVGQVAAWMLSSQRDRSFNTFFHEDPYDAILDITDFRNGDSVNQLSDPRIDSPMRGFYEVQETFFDLFDLAPDQDIIQTITRNPGSKHTILTGNLPAGIPSWDDRFNEPDLDRTLGANTPGDLLHVPDSPLRPEIIATANDFNGAPRLADLLLAWGIGPTYIPDPTRPTTDISFSDVDEGKRWITLSEALAIGLGFETDQISYDVSEPDADNIWVDAFTVDEQILDNGHLAIDNYVAYLNDPTQDTNPSIPDFNAEFDIRRGTGVPMALGVIDQTRAITPLTSGTEAPDLAALLAAPTFGQININTAPVEVLRLLPGLSPSLSSYYPNNISTDTDPEWWGTQQDWNLPDLSTPLTAPDIAATIVGYRDRNFVQPRYRSINIDYQETNPVNYASSNPDDNNAEDNTPKHANNLVDETPVPDPASWDHRDRQSISGIDGLRQSPGFGSLGEVLAVTLDEQAKGRLGDLLGVNHPQLSIQQYAHDDLNMDGDSDSVLAIDPQLFGGIIHGTTVDDYAERLAIADGILNTISVRSDFYAVWFVVHAYQESDVANLQPEDPLVPSIAKRYVMVVDRTNVRNPGDTPKVVFLREVPM